jgi:hypothetical protein
VGSRMAWSRSATIWLGLATALPLLYLAGFIPIFFILQDSPNPLVGRGMEHTLFVIAGFAMAIYFVVELVYLVHVVAVYRGNALRKVAWTVGFVLASPLAMIAYWIMNVRKLDGPDDAAANVVV